MLGKPRVCFVLRSSPDEVNCLGPQPNNPSRTPMFLFRRKRPQPLIIPRAEHCISRNDIDPDALKVLYRLTSLNHEAYLVGGSVRDLLLGRTPKDFDVGTDARPNEIRREFRNCFLVGKRFRLAHIVFGKKVIETATFRKAPDPNDVQDEHGLYQSVDNNYGTPEEDALRRDFTVNGLFYDIRTFSVIDYVGGLKDLKAKLIRSIGDPTIRFREDPVRMMRAVRFAAKLGFDICPNDIKAIRRYAPELENASSSRLCEEIQRLFVRGASERSLRLAYDYRLLHALLPTLAAWLDADPVHQEALWASLAALDAVSADTETSSATAFAALYRPMVQESVRKSKELGGRRGGNERYLLRTAAEKALQPAVKKYRLPRAVWMTAVDILELSSRFLSPPKADSARDVRFANHGIFPEVLVGAQVIARLEPDANWQLEAWRRFVREMVPDAETLEAGGLPLGRLNPHSRKARRRRPRRRRRDTAAFETQPT